MSDHERISWVNLLVNLVVPAWYFQRILSLPADADLFGPRMVPFVVSLVTAAILVSVACEILLRIVQKQQGEGAGSARRDERDDLINLKAARNAHGVLGAALIVVLVQIALLEWSVRHWRRPADADSVLELLATGPLQAMHVAQLLLAALALGAITLNASRIFYYRRGY